MTEKFGNFWELNAAYIWPQPRGPHATRTGSTARQLLACHQPRTQINCPNYPSPWSSSKNISLVNSAGKEAAWNQETGMNSEGGFGAGGRGGCDRWSFTSYSRTTLGCLSSFSVAISLFICTGHPSTRTIDL